MAVGPLLCANITQKFSFPVCKISKKSKMSIGKVYLPSEKLTNIKFSDGASVLKKCHGIWVCYLNISESNGYSAAGKMVRRKAPPSPPF